MIVTALTEMFHLRHPIMLAPMGGVAGGHLAAAVSNAGGLGLVGGGYGDPTWMHAELSRVKRETRYAWGVGLITWSIQKGVLDIALGYRPDAFMLSFGNPQPYASAIKAAGCKLICQVQDVEQARAAQRAGADLIVAEGTEAGGHSGIRGTLPLVPAVIDAVGSLPVVAAGGIADGRGLAASLMLGAQGVLMGTRFYASSEALGSESAKRRLVSAHAGDTVRTPVFDIVRGLAWPAENHGRALRNRFLNSWEGHEAELAAVIDTERTAYQTAAREGNFDTAVIWAGEAIDLIDGIEGAGALVTRISAEAEARLQAGAKLSRQESLHA
jgi:nitronate monooxygenase